MTGGKKSKCVRLLFLAAVIFSPGSSDLMALFGQFLMSEMAFG